MPKITLLFFFLFVGASAQSQVISKIAFGSCGHQDKPQPVIETAASMSPDLFIYLGDNIYGDTEDMTVLKGKYTKLGVKPEFEKLKETCPVIATWDDHDYGVNDGGKEYPKKAESKEIFLNFWEEPANSERRKHEGIYTSYMYGKKGKRVQVILLDTRTFRTPLAHAVLDGLHKNDYAPNKDKINTFLGKEQWKWLEAELKKEADIRIIGSSIQFGIEYNGWESWANFPKEREKMFGLIKKTKANGIVFISGDVHWAEISKQKQEGIYPVYDITSSGITQTWDKVEPNKYRVGKAFQANNFGMIEIDWNKPNPEVYFRIYDVKGEVKINQALTIADISF
jgi:alkaline phosphatase D